MAANERFLSINEIAACLGVSRWTVMRALDDGEIPSVAIRGARRVDPADLHAWIAAQKAVSLARMDASRAPMAANRPVGRPRKTAVA